MGSGGLVGHRESMNGNQRRTPVVIETSDGLKHERKILYGNGCKWSSDCFKCPLPNCTGWKIKAISLRQPWATLTVLGLKDVDNRPWSTDYRGRILIHAAEGKNYFPSPFKESWLLEQLDEAGRDLYFTTSRPRGAIIGEAVLVDCVQTSSSPWFKGPFGLVLENSKRYDKPIPCKGALKLFEVNI